MDKQCERCGGTGMEDSGGTHPWGEQIMIPCDHGEPQPPSASVERELPPLPKGKAVHFLTTAYPGERRECLYTADDMQAYARAALAPSPGVDAAEQKPVPFRLGNEYQTQAGDWVRFVSVHNEGTSHETMADENGHHRYTQRDFGRLTGTAHDYSEPGNTPPLYAVPSPAASADEWMAEAERLVDDHVFACVLYAKDKGSMTTVKAARAALLAHLKARP